jgi:general nucleoside transport system ATP-binding protein
VSSPNTDARGITERRIDFHRSELTDIPLIMAPALELSGIRKFFGDFLALDDARLSVDYGEVHALLGENGAGKSSLMNVAAGLYSPDAGSIKVAGVSCRFSGPRDSMRRGIGMIHQNFKLVKRFTAAENVLLANPRGSFRDGRKAIERELRAKADALGFRVDMARRIGELSIAEQQRVEIIKALVAGARILILDEPTAVLTENEAQRLLATVREIALQGAAVVLVTHKLRDVKAFANRVTIMRAGKTVTTLDPQDATAADLTTLTVGSNVVTPGRSAKTAGDSRLIVSGLASAAEGHAALVEATFVVRSGEIYGIAGVGGNGQTELAEALVGARSPTAGAISIKRPGSQTPINMTEAPPRQRRNHGVAYVPADRQSLGLASSLSITDNFSIGFIHEGAFGSALRVDGAAMRRATQVAIGEFEVQGVRSLAQRAGLLSGGNAQKLILAREFSGSPSIIVAHSPTRGLDVRACAAVHRRLLDARDVGAAVVLISEDLDEVLGIADRIGVMTRGRIVAEFEAPADRQAVGRAMVDHA